MKDKGGNIMPQPLGRMDHLRDWNLREIELDGFQADKQGKPIRLPQIKANEKVIAALDLSVYAELFICNSLEDMQEVFSWWYDEGRAFRVRWYIGVYYGDNINIEVGPGIQEVNMVIAEFAPSAPKEVKMVLAAYSAGNPGVAKKLCELCAGFNTVTQVKNLVGWGPFEHNTARKNELWDKIKNM
jgi:hypothetical protein